MSSITWVRIVSYGLLLSGLLFSCENGRETPQIPQPPVTTAPISSTTGSTVPVSTTPVSGTPVSGTPVSTTPVATTSVSTTTITPPTPTPPTTTPPVTQPPPSSPTPTYSDGNENPLLTLGNLTGATTNPDNASNFLLLKDQYAVAYNKSRGHAGWVAWHLQKSDFGTAQRQNDFRPDTSLPTGWYQVRPTDYSSVDGFDRGHLCPSADRTDTKINNSATFLMTNIIPQAPSLNRGFWAEMEAFCRELVFAGNELYIYSGAYGIGGSGSNGPKSTMTGNKVTVPARIWKVVVAIPQGDDDASRISAQTIVVAVNVPNEEISENKSWDDFLVSPRSIETSGGITFFSKLSSNLRASLTTKIYTPAPVVAPTPTTPSPTPTGDTPCGFYKSKQLYKGPQGGCYYINSNGNKTYVDRSYCNC